MSLKVGDRVYADPDGGTVYDGLRGRLLLLQEDHESWCASHVLWDKDIPKHFHENNYDGYEGLRVGPSPHLYRVSLTTLLPVSPLEQLAAVAE